MNKKLLSVFLALAIAVQLAFPLYSILTSRAEKSSIEKNGETFRLSLMYAEYYDGLCWYDIPAYGDSEIMHYAEVSTGADGNAVFNVTAVKPSSPDYIAAEGKYSRYEFPRQLMKSDKYDGMNIDFTTANEMGTVFTYGDDRITVGANEIIAEVKIYNGEIITKEIYIDTVPVNQVLEYLNEPEGSF